MSNYSQITDFSAKDSLSDSDPEKIILGADIDDELAAISTAVSSKADAASTNTFTVAQNFVGQVTLTHNGVGSNSALYINATPNPFVAFYASADTANNRLWDMGVDAERFLARVGNDASSAFTNWLVVDRTANVVDSINLLATAVQVNTIDMTPATGSFTATLSGMTGATTGTLNYKKIGNTVILYNSSASDITGTSNTTAMSISGIPAAINPAAQRVVCSAFVNSGAYVSGFAQVSNANAIAASIPGNFTGSGGKGLPGGWCIVYQM